MKASTPSILARNIFFGEGPRWHEGRLWFSDFYARAVNSISLAGDLQCEFSINDQPSGLGWMPDGSLLVVSMRNRQVLRRRPDGTIGTHADLSAIADFHCNDMVVDSAGGAYVGNFGFNLDAEISARGIENVLTDHPTAKLAYITPDGSARVAAEGLHFPNGSVITPDGKTLIIGETLAGVLTAFDIDAQGGLSGRRIWAAILPRIPDGIALDQSGAIWVANPMRSECVRIAQGGNVLEIIDTQMPCFACMLGGEDGKNLFMLTAPTSDGHTAAAAPKGNLLVAKVEYAAAGFP